MTDEKKRPALKEDRFKLAEQERNVWAVVPTHGTPFEALADSAYWSHCARKLAIGDLIEVRAEDATYYGELLVMDVGPQWARVQAINFVQLAEAEEEVGAASVHHGLRAKWNGPHDKFVVIRDSDKTILRTGFTKKDEANAWIAGHAKSMAA